MFDFFKTMGQGALYLILSPFILIGVALYAVYALIVFFVMFIKRIVLFFKGEDMKEEMRIDKVARMHLDNQDELEEAKQEQDSSINVPVTNVVKEEKTTIIQPLIIQTDEQNRIKGVQYVNPNGTLGPSGDFQTQRIESSPAPEQIASQASVDPNLGVDDNEEDYE